MERKKIEDNRGATYPPLMLENLKPLVKNNSSMMKMKMTRIEKK